MKLNSCKIDFKFKFKSQNRKTEKEKELNKKKIEEEAYLAAARLAGPTSQPTEAQPGIPIWYATGKRDPPKETIVFFLRSGEAAQWRSPAARCCGGV
jgi:hypothetical protein